MPVDFCPLIDDVLDEAKPLASELKRQGFPFLLQPVLPSRTTAETFQRVLSTQPKAVLIDFTLLGRPLVKVETLGANLVRRNVRAAFVTKDRNIVDEGPRQINGLTIPVFQKQRLISDAVYLEQCVEYLGGRLSATVNDNLEERLSFLQEKRLLSRLTQRERGELKALLARVELEDGEELDRIKGSESQINDEINKTLALVSEITRKLKNVR
jgi:hypothetical protein